MRSGWSWSLFKSLNVQYNRAIRFVRRTALALYASVPQAMSEALLNLLSDREKCTDSFY